MRRLIILSLLLSAVALHAQLPPVPATPINVIIDTDAGSDPDDVHAVAVALRLRQLGYLNIKALTSSTWLDKSTAFLNLMLFHGGLTSSDIPLGAYRGPRPPNAGGAGCFGGDSSDNYAGAILSALPNVPNVGRASFPDAVAVMRAALGGAADKSVVIVTLGGLSNIAGLLQSGANANGDSFGSGQFLWDTKVARMVSQFSGFPQWPYTASPYSQWAGYNASCDAPAAQYVFGHNGAVPIFGAPMQVSMYIGGCFDGTGSGCTSALPTSSPARMASAKFKDLGPTYYTVGSGNFGRPAWDSGALFYALVGTSDPGGGAYYTSSPNGTMSFVATYPATSTWSTATSSNHFFVINTARWVTQQSAMNTLLQDDYLPSLPQVQPPPPLSRCDLNADGKTDIEDVSFAVAQARGSSMCVTADITGDGKCDLLDVKRVLTAAITGVCQAGPGL